MSTVSATSFSRRLARRNVSASRELRRTMDGSVVKNACLTGAESLLKTEEDFLSSLSQINTAVLNTLLQVTDAHDLGGDHWQALKLLNDRFHSLWELTASCFQALKQKYELLAVDLPDIYLMTKESHFLQGYTEYFVSATNYLVMKGFEKSAKQTSYWKANKKLLMQLVGEPMETPINVLLQRVLIEPFRDHVQQYSLLLSKLNGTLSKEAGIAPLTDCLTGFVNLQSYISQSLDEAFQTKILWGSLSHKLTAAFCTPERRIQEDSKSVPVTVTTGRFDRVLLFSDVLVFLQGSEAHIFNLTTVWADSTVKQKSEQNNHILRIVTPEEEYFLSTKDPQNQALWLWKLNQLIRQSLEGKRDFPLWGRTGEAANPPTSRLSKYTYKNEGRFKSAVYEGDMSWGKPHGKGTLKWPNGRNHVGEFKFGQENGFGICIIPDLSRDSYDCYKCHWRNGAMQGYGICEYADESVYKGYFKDNMRHGFGILENVVSTTNPFTYTGNWDKDKRTGYGVLDNSHKGERYIGMWLDNQRHGPGIVLLHTGSCYQGIFNANKLVGNGVLITEENLVYEGEFTEECLLSGKGKLMFANGFTLEGSFNRSGDSGLQTQGVLSTACGYQDQFLKRKHQFGVGTFPVEERWQGMFQQFQKYLQSGCKTEVEEMFLGFNVKSSKKVRKSQEYLYCQRDSEEVSCKIEDIMKEVSLQQAPEALKSYLEKAFNSSHHPLKKHIKMLSVAFQATYSGLGANLHLLSMAQEEIKYYAKKLWEFFRALIAMTADKVDRSHSRLQSEEISEDLNPYTLILPAILPRFHPDLFMLYMLYHQQEDALYWQGIVRLGVLTDTKLLEFLDVQRQLWPLKDVKLTTNQVTRRPGIPHKTLPTPRPRRKRYSIVKHKCFNSATECLQKIISTVDPEEKLEIILKTYKEIETTVSRVVNKDYKLPMDDLLPLLIYVVSRAGVQHLGAEIHFIQDLMDPSNRGGIYDFLLTALESCYEHIQKDEIRLFK
ncbi:ALS2 C-terminal-like protein isoform X2 [Pseudophryne corroboree]|uniref:ALS2 C-terminal-like protein isoform X2 n=1 Tax=Pseudophryne corroboree TaxID=495146 RepID=UPI0030820583